MNAKGKSLKVNYILDLILNIELQRNAVFHRNMKKGKGGWNEWPENQA